MASGKFSVPTPVNEPVLSYAPGTPERNAIVAELARQGGEIPEIPCVIGGRHVYTGNVIDVTNPSAHGEVLAKLHMAGPEEIRASVQASEAARRDWSGLPWEARAAVLLKAAQLLTGDRWRHRINAATMLGQSKTVHQAEIDSACELIDFWRFNPWYADQIYGDQPPVSTGAAWNRLEHRPLDGFVLAIAPFNFTSIALNLPTAPALMGNTVLWKPARTSALSCWHLYLLLEEAGLPPGVINMVHGRGVDVGKLVLPDPHLAGIHFTGSTGVFQQMWKTVGDNIETYRQYPRIVGETGGKDFIFAHPSADVEILSVAILRGGYEYQGQKCSAASRIYVPKSLWPEVCDRVVAGLEEMKQGDVRDMSNFVGAVIDERAFRKHQEYLEIAHNTAEIVAGGTSDGTEGWFIAPTFVRVDDPRHQLMVEEIFGPIVTCYVYDDADVGEALNWVDNTSPYALTGAVFAQDRYAVQQATESLRFAAGNFYVNDKPTGAVVGQQPFGGGRASGTNDKAGSALNLMRWVSPRTIKETFDPPRDWRYPFLG